MRGRRSTDRQGLGHCHQWSPPCRGVAYTPEPILLPRQVEAIFRPAQLRDNELLEVFAKRLPGFVSASTPEVSKNYMERLILEDKLWEQLHVVLVKCFDPRFPFPDKLRIIVAFFDIFDVAFDVLKDSESTIIDWRSPDVNLLFGHIGGFETRVALSSPSIRSSISISVQFSSAVNSAMLCCLNSPCGTAVESLS